MNMNQNPTIEEFREKVSVCRDEDAHHILWIRSDGEVYIDALPIDQTPAIFEVAQKDLKIRYPSWERCNGYVGKGAAADLEFMTRLFNSMVFEWESSRSHRVKRYIDNF